jgi:hypothetical protein
MEKEQTGAAISTSLLGLRTRPYGGDSVRLSERERYIIRCSAQIVS